MTEYATQHMDECCLTFERTTRKNADFSAHRYTECVLFQHAVSKTSSSYNYSHTDENKEKEARAAELRAEHEEVKEAAEILAKLPATFNESLVMLMKWRKMTNEQLAEKSLLSSKTIQRLRADPNHKSDEDTITAISIGLQLHPSISMSLMEKAGHKLKVGEKGATYAHMLSSRYKGTIHEVNEYLEIAGFTPLSGKE
jgi:hypothetical protein